MSHEAIRNEKGIQKADEEGIKHHLLPYLGDVLYEFLCHILGEVLGPESKLERCLLLDILTLDLKNINSWINIYFLFKVLFKNSFKSYFVIQSILKLLNTKTKHGMVSVVHTFFSSLSQVTRFWLSVYWSPKYQVSLKPTVLTT